MLPVFEKEFKKLQKKYPSLQKDFQDFQNVLKLFPIGM
jgi:hypothetical protein